MNPDEFLGALRQMVRPTCPALPPEMDLEDLLKARALLDPDDMQTHPWREVAARLGKRQDLEENVFLLGLALDEAISRRLPNHDSAALHDLGVIRTSDFGVDGTSFMTIPTVNTGDLLVVAGFVSRLPQNHPLHAEPADELFHFENGRVGRQPAILLGRCLPVISGPALVKPWYLLSAALQLTSQQAFFQRQAEQARALANRERELVEEREALLRETGVEGELRRLKSEMAELKQALSQGAKP
jgi:hypothetical protein